jgi:hypothetical protein
MKINNLAPIALFVYKRLDYLKILINSLKNNILSKKSIIFVFSDGWKNNRDKEKVLNLRKYIANISGFRKVFIILRPNNFGLSKNIINGINFVLKKNKKIIVLEEDLKLSKNFLTFINSGLKIYENEKRIASINGWFFPLSSKKNIEDTFFIRGADCWGWGTWRRAWKKFDTDGQRLLNKIRKNKLEKLFNFNNSFNYMKMLQNQINKKNQSWAIRWYASAFLENMYTLHPKSSLVENTGTKNGENSKFDFLNLSSSISKKKYQPITKQKIIESSNARKAIENFFNQNIFFKLKERIKNFLNV